MPKEVSETKEPQAPLVPQPKGVWNEKMMDDLLAAQDFGTLLSNSYLYRHFDSDRLFQVVDWTRLHGCEKGHVPILYMYLRNLIKHEVGMVLSQQQFEEALFCVVNLLLRTAQDVVCCKRLYAVKGVEDCYSNLRAKIHYWLDKFTHRRWPTLRKMISSHTLTSDVSPPPVWCTACSVSMISASTIYFRQPSDELIQSAKETSAHVKDIRAEVTTNFLGWAKERTWKEFLTQDYKDREHE